jgi:penicillin amidase
VTARRFALLIAMSLIPAVAILLGFAAWVALGVRAGGSLPTGTLAGIVGVRAPVTILRDDRGIPHVRARDERDAFFAEGYLQGTDRLFQLDLYRRLVEGRLAEIFGKIALPTDVNARTVDVPAIARAQFASLSPRERDDLDAFSDGVNEAIATRPLPPEFRVLGYRPEPWTPQDSLVASFATVLALTDSWYDVATRADVVRALGPRGRDAFYPITDPAYDSPTTGTAKAPVAPLPPLDVPFPEASPLRVAERDAREGLGSNEFAAGAALTATHRALLANDPHLELRMPGVWWLVDLKAPGLHVAGATLAGVPGVILGHNAHLAWGATNGTVATVRVFRERFTSATADTYRVGGATLRAEHRSETFKVRFANEYRRDYLRTRDGFVFADFGTEKLAAAWTADLDRRSSFAQFDALDRAPTARDALAALRAYPGPPQNFVLADDRGDAGYVLAGDIPLDDAWGLAEHDGSTTSALPERDVPFAALPQVAPARGVFVHTANARVYGAGYPYRLSAAFAPPYRAARIAEDLAKRPYDVAGFAAAQADVTSLPERDLARAAVAALARAHVDRDSDLAPAFAALRSFDGRFTPSSRGAVYVVALRHAAIERLVRMHLPRAVALRYLASDGGEALVALMRMLRERPRGWVPHDDLDAFLVAAVREAVAAVRASGDADASWATVGMRVAEHPLAGLGLKLWDGVPFPGLGDGYTPHVQGPSDTQSFRAVWDVGAWEAGGIVIPQGESGEPGSDHYRDLAPVWLAGTLVPLPFDDVAVNRAARTTLVLRP